MAECKISSSYYVHEEAEQMARVCTEEKGQLARVVQQDESVRNGCNRYETGKTIHIPGLFCQLQRGG